MFGFRVPPKDANSLFRTETTFGLQSSAGGLVMQTPNYYNYYKGEKPDLDEPTFKRRAPEWERDPIEGVGVPRLVGEILTQKEPTVTYGVSLGYTKMPPSESGWYWNRKQGHEGVVLYVFELGGYFYALDPSGKSQWDVRIMRDCEWAGPLVEPSN